MPRPSPGLINKVFEKEQFLAKKHAAFYTTLAWWEEPKRRGPKRKAGQTPRSSCYYCGRASDCISHCPPVDTVELLGLAYCIRRAAETKGTIFVRVPACIQCWWYLRDYNLFCLSSQYDAVKSKLRWPERVTRKGKRVTLYPITLSDKN